jgi:parallel beta-helix repeat protein
MFQHDMSTDTRIAHTPALVLAVLSTLFLVSCGTTLLPMWIDVRASRFAAGAKGDDTTDDTAAIQAAINSIPIHHTGTVFIPPGIYKITAPINFKGRTVHLECTDPRATVIHQISPDLSGIVMSDYSSVRNCGIKGTNVARALHASGIDAGGTTRITLEGNIIEEWQKQGIVTGENSSWWIIRNNIIRNNHDEGILFGSGTSDCLVDGNDIYGNWKNALDFNGPHHTIVNNSLHGNGHTDPVCLSDCNGMILFASPDTTDIHNVVIANNRIYSNTNFGIMIASSDITSIYNVWVGSNVLWGNGLTGIKLEQGGGGNLLFVSIANNISIRNGVAGLLLDNHTRTTGITTGVHVMGNTFLHNTGWGIWIYNPEVTNTTIAYNIAYANTSGAVLDSGTNTSFHANCFVLTDPICSTLLNRRPEYSDVDGLGGGT